MTCFRYGRARLRRCGIHPRPTHPVRCTLRVAVLALLAVVLIALPAAAAATPLHAHYSGTFTITFATGPGLSDELYFSGSGFATPGGPSTVAGYSTLRPAPGPAGVCTRTEHDEVTLTLNGGQLHLRNDAQDCFDPLTQPGRMLIAGHGTWTITGGTGAYTGTTGSGTVDVSAEVTTLGPGRATGTFDRLAFDGELR